MSKALLAALALLLARGAGLAQPPPPAPMLLGRVSANRTHVAFFYAGDLWTVERAGGEARKLPAPAGTSNNFPVYSPDGSQLAFSRLTGGNWDLYVAPAAGGEARRLTFHPANDYAQGWSPDGKSILFSSNRDVDVRLYTVEAGGSPLPKELPLPKALAGALSPDGARVAYSPYSGNPGDWRFYRGGSKGAIWIAQVRDGALEKLPPGDYNDYFPVWSGNKIYFVSDRNGIYNLYAHDLSTKRTTPALTNFAQYGIRWAGPAPGGVVFVRDGRIHLHDAAANQTRVVPVTAAPDAAELKPRTVNASRTIDWASPSHDGGRVAFSARGEVLILDADDGDVRNLTATTAAAERFPALSPDGKWLAYFSDESGEYLLHVRPADGAGAVKKISVEAKPTFYRELTWSPDSRRVAFADKRLALWVADVAAGTARQADRSTYSYQEELHPAWSPDGRWLAYSKHLKNRARTVYIYDAQTGQTRQVTDGVTHTESPVFDRGGRLLYFVSSPAAGTSEYGWGVLAGVMARPLVTRRAHALVLRDGDPAPILPNNAPNPDFKFEDSDAPVRIDFEGLTSRVVDLPMQQRDFAQLLAGRAGQVFAVVNEWPKSPALGTNPARSIHLYDLSKPPKVERVVEEIGGYELSGDGRRLLYVKGNDWFVVAATPDVKAGEGKLDFKQMEVTVDPRAEWRQMYREAWRVMRDWFYDPNHHGQNLAALEKHYAEYLPSVARRGDLNGLMNMGLGHVSVSHMGTGGGDSPPAGPPARVGLLGADYEIAGNRYRFKRVYRAAHFHSAIGPAPAPLDRPGASAREGEYLIEVDGQNVDATRSVYSYFEGRGAQIKIKVGPNPNGDGARTLSVFPLPNETPLRGANRAEANRRRVEQLSGGRLGYVFVQNWGPNTVDAIRGLSGYSDRAGLIIDQRGNGGGITPDYLIEWLRRRPLYYYMFREGDDIPTPVNPGPAARVLIADDGNFSAAETFAFMWKLARLGPVVGTRTGGGGIGPYVFTPRFIDGGQIQLPNRAAYHPDGTSWGIENVGISPDVEVELTPRDFIAGRDPQLERAVQVALAEVAKNPVVRPKKPKYPIHR
ncbi:MAG: PDZ domain-containing protein [Acidobacteria bacterium]|nr:PDZ domain-containing protein [Acidobacteriota bacterium]